MVLPFKYMELNEVTQASPCKSKSSLYAAIKRGDAPPPDRIGGRSLWRSDRIAEWLCSLAAAADAERSERTEKAREKAQRMISGRAGRERAAA